MGIGQASGDDRRSRRPRRPSRARCSRSAIDGARGILLNITGPSSMGLFEMNAAAEIIHGVAHQDANIIFGTVIDDEMGDEVKVTVIAAGFDRVEGEPAPRVEAKAAPQRRRGSPSCSPTSTRILSTTTTTTSTSRPSSSEAAPTRRPDAPGGVIGCDVIGER
jgi:cell division protein FtsZ